MARKHSAVPKRARAPLNDRDLAQFAEGRHYDLAGKLGARLVSDGAGFGVWAPAARHVSVVGDFNDWRPDAHPLTPLGRSGVWTGFVEGARKGQLYKYRIESDRRGYRVSKADPFGLWHETPPSTASVLWDTDYEWGDAEWMERRKQVRTERSPISIYEVHLGSWLRPDDDPERKLGYRELADRLVDYVAQQGFTHVELMPPLEHPFHGSWGYQVTGYFAPSSRYGTPQDLMHLIDLLHQRGIGVVLDWVPSHFPADEHGLAFFDGSRLFEYPDPKVGYQPDWKSYVFNYGRGEVRSFLISSAMFWLDRYHVDAIRVDAVASMLYLDYSRNEGEWIRNKYGGRENLEAIAFLKDLNNEARRRHPEVSMIAEESTAWPMVSRPTHLGGLGFHMKWDMGWMHDTLEYMRLDPIHRKFNHDKLTFRPMYAFSENFLLALSHDEVVHGKGSLIGKMPGDRWQRFANLRTLYGLMWAESGKKLLFMGCEFGQWREWSHDRGLDWHLLTYPLHAGLQQWVRDLNRVYRAEPALHELDFEGRGFTWIDCKDTDQSVFAFLRRSADERSQVAVIANLTPVPRYDYRVGLPRGGRYRELLNSDATSYGGSGLGNYGEVEATAMTYHELPYSASLTLPPLSVLWLKVPDPPGDGDDASRERKAGRKTDSRAADKPADATAAGRPAGKESAEPATREM